MKTTFTPFPHSHPLPAAAGGPKTRPTLLRLAALLLATVAARADDWAPNLTFGAVWETNATHANASADQIDSLRLEGDLLAAQRYPLGRDDAVLATARFAGEWWPRYNALAAGAAGARLEWRHTLGTGPLAPELSLGGRADAIVAKDTGRRGVATGIVITARKRFNALTRLTLAHDVSWLDARYGVYDRAASETSLELERDLNRLTRLVFTARFRDGDIVSYAAGPRPDLEALAPQRIDTEVFGRTLTAHRIDARTWSGRAAFVRALDDNSAVIVSYEARRTQRDSLRYANHVLAISFVQQF